MTEAKHKKANLVKLLIEKGWNPPKPTDVITERIAADIAKLDERNYGGFYKEPTLVLTPNQVKLLGYFSEGMDRNEVAEKLGISGETVKSHLKRISQKLGAKNTVHAVSLAMREGLIT